MIKLEVEEYCQECPAFEPDVDSNTWYDPTDNLPSVSDTIIHCRYRKRCANMVRYLERKMKNNEHS